MPRPVGSAAELERRRKRAVQAVADFQLLATVASVLGVHPKTVARWVRLARQPDGLDARPQPGPTASLCSAHLRRLEGLLSQGAKAHGWPNELWTAARVSINTVTKLLVDAGTAAARFQHDALRNLPCKRLQLDEIWAFVGAKDKNIPAERAGEDGIGSNWTWVAIDAETKLIPSWLVGLRDAEHATAFVGDLAGRLASRVQITTDGLKAYLEAMEAGFGGEVDYAVLHKVYGRGNDTPEARYSPAECVGCDKKGVSGSPDPAHVNTSYVERQNLTMRMRMRRFTRLTNAFSKKLANHEHAVALHFFAYNFVTRHQTLRMPPALKAKVTDHIWDFAELVELVDRAEAERRTTGLPVVRDKRAI